MPRLNLLRPHRRSHQPSTNVSPPPTASSPAPPPSISSPDTSATPSSSLPPLDIGSPGLGAIGQWLQSPVNATTTTTTPASATTTTTTLAPSSAFSRTSTPWTTTTAPTPAPALPTTPAKPSSSSSSSSSSNPHPPAPADRKHRQPALRLASAPPSIPPAKHPTKLARLNPMSLLLRRRSSQTQAREKEKDLLPEVNFNPGIIYGTRHPDWSEHAVREGRALSPVVVGAEGRGRWEQQQQGRVSSPPVPGPVGTDTAGTSLVEEEEEVAKDPRAESPLSFLTDNEGDLHPPPPAEAQDIGHRRGVTLVDHPLASPHHAAQNSSRFSFDESAVPSAAPSFRKQRGDDDDNDDDDDDDDDDGYEYEDEGDFQFDMGDGEEDDGFERANEGLFETHNGAPILQDQVSALQAAVQAMTLGNPALGGDPGPGVNPEEEEQAMPNLGARKRLGNIANPRGLDLTEEDLAFLHEDSGLAGYENEYDEDDGDDMYYEDGIINRILPLSPEQQQQPVISDGAHLPLQNNLSPLLPLQNNPSPLLTPSTDPNAGINHHRLSLATNDGSLSPSPYEPHTFPPFLNPIGGGFTSPLNHSHQLLTNSLALHSLPPAPHRFSTISDPDTPDFGSSHFSSPHYSPYPDDIIGAHPLPADYSTDPCSAIIAAANAAALTADTDGTYGREFGFYASTLAPNELGGFFGRIGAPSQELRLPVRRPSLTPISERSEGSYRNSLMSPLSTGSPGSPISPPSPVPAAVGVGGTLPSPPAPPGLRHPGSRAMLPTKGSFEDGIGVGGGGGGGISATS
ncbi:hypothetical protein EX30DRAFT_350788 [Ascodesmis nigricans]|uniref:Uncharacterized protein n=1 Tax=Ascodesmis nigricans TaxID=341454 RepID=A0A4V6RHC6_9PEZI|nr:hypothetical protein EX30DRAFT_350788 [Ascodesmis nigricans]